MASETSQLTEEVTANTQSDSLEDAREICADGNYFLNNLRKYLKMNSESHEVIESVAKVSGVGRKLQRVNSE